MCGEKWGEEGGCSLGCWRGMSTDFKDPKIAAWPLMDSVL
jgi:hypothetical protein